MKISCLPVSLFEEIAENRMSLPEWAAAARETGYTGFDLSVVMLKNHTAAYLGALAEELGRVGIPPVMATTYPDFTHPDAAQRKREAAYLGRDIALCAQLGVPYLRVLAGQAHPQTARRDGIAWAVEHLRRADETARSFGVTLLYENHAKPSAWQYRDFSYPLDIFGAIMEQLNDTGIRLNFDIGNVVSLGGDPLSIFDRYYDRIDAIHISDMARWGEFGPVLIGTGVSPIRQVLEEAVRRRFAGWYCVEEASGTGLDGIRAAYRYVSGVLSAPPAN